MLREIERRRRNLRIILFGIILVTLPFYCLGFVLWATAPQNGPRNGTATPTATATPIGFDITATNTLLPSITPFFTVTPLSPLLPTPFQFIPPAIPPTSPPLPTAVSIPTSTTAPTLTPIPTLPPQPTDTPPPAATATPPQPQATDTPLPLPTNTPTPDLIEPVAPDS